MQITKKIYSALFLLVIAAGCQKPQPPPPEPAAQLRELAELVTAEFELSKVVRARDEATWYKLGERRMLVACKGYVKAGIDFTQIRDIDIDRNGKNLTVRLPPARILSFSVPPERIRVVYTDIGRFRDPFSQSETGAILQEAERQLRRQADSLDVLKQAEKNAATFVTRYFQLAGYTQVRVAFRYGERP